MLTVDGKALYYVVFSFPVVSFSLRKMYNFLIRRKLSWTGYSTKW